MMRSPPLMSTRDPNEPDLSRRLARLAVSPEILVDMAKNVEWITVRVHTAPLPTDATINYVYLDDLTQTLYLVLMSETFREIEPNAVPPLLDPPRFQRWFGPGAPE